MTHPGTESLKPLVALVGKESGIVYCGSKPLNCSVSAMHLLTAAADAQTAYSRLLLSPSTRRELPPRLRVWLVEDIIYNGEKTTDGSSDIGLDDAVRLGMITLPKNVPSLVLYSPIQMRAELALNSRQHCLGKGMLMVDPTRARDLHLRDSCKKLVMNFPARSPTGHLRDEGHGGGHEAAVRQCAARSGAAHASHEREDSRGARVHHGSVNRFECRGRKKLVVVVEQEDVLCK